MKFFLFISYLMTIYSIKETTAQIIFQKTFTATPNDLVGTYVQQTSDGGYIIAGYSNNKASLIKTNAVGNTEWTKTFGGSNYCDSYSVQQTTDGGYIITGETIVFGSADNDVYVSRTDTSGNTLWTKIYGSMGNEIGVCVQQTADSGFIIAGATNGFGAGSDDVYLIKSNGNGDTLWTKTYGGTGSDNGASVQQTSDGGYIISGGTYSFGAGSDDVYLIKTNDTGNITWTKTYGGANLDYGHSLQQTSDGGYIITGGTNSFGAGLQDVYLIRTDLNGDTLWTKTFGGTGEDSGFSVQQTSDGGFIVAGITQSSGAGYSDVYLLKTDTNGILIWSKTFGEAGYEEGQCVQQTTDGGYIVTGRTTSFGAGGNSVYLIKTDAGGNSGCNQGIPVTITGTPATQVGGTATLVSSGGTVNISINPVGNSGSVTTLCTSDGIKQITAEALFLVSPNPFTNVLFIKGTKENGVVVLFDAMGKEMIRQKTFNADSEINTQNLLPGFYLLSYTVGNRSEHVKLSKFQ